jgi:hypothetical protein
MDPAHRVQHGPPTLTLDREVGAYYVNNPPGRCDALSNEDVPSASSPENHPTSPGPSAPQCEGGSLARVRYMCIQPITVRYFGTGSTGPSSGPSPPS